ncbi:MAG: hypothetical protein WAX77_16490 [Methylococcaceae bacterium]
MKYLDGKEVEIGDKVELWNGNNGVVVCSIDRDEYSELYSKNDWGYLKEGVLIKSEQAGLIHFVEADEDLILLKRFEAG